METVLYRITREALLNVDGHSQARRVDIALAQSDDVIVLSIRDDGRGFDASAFVRAPAVYPGLSTMDDLARSVRGTMRLTSGRGAGTEVRVRLPLEPVRPYGSELSQVTSRG